MPRRSKGPRLYLDPKRDQWVIRDGAHFIRTRCGSRDNVAAEKFLSRYIAEKHRPDASPAPLIAEILAVYAAEVAPHRKTARNLSYNIGNLLKYWGEKKTTDINTRACRLYATTKSALGAGSDIKVLKAATMYWHAEYGPLAVMPIFWRPTENPPKDRWLTRSEAARLLKASRSHEYLRRLILLGLYTGSRPGVLLSLHWDQIDFATGFMSRTRKDKVEDKHKRAPKVKLGRRILSHLARWKKGDGKIALVCRYSDAQTKPMIDPHRSWKRIVKEADLPGVTRHTLRHTRATWMMQKGVPIWEAAGFLGMTVKTLETVYGHHSPDHQDQAANI
jgi:integrase